MYEKIIIYKSFLMIKNIWAINKLILFFYKCHSVIIYANSRIDYIGSIPICQYYASMSYINLQHVPFLLSLNECIASMLYDNNY